MTGIILNYNNESGNGLVRPLDPIMRPPRPLRFSAPELKDTIKKGDRVTFDAEPMGIVATNVQLIPV